MFSLLRFSNHVKNTYFPMCSLTNAFGMVMPERSFSNEKYRYGFNGKENDNEVKGVGNSIDFGARIYDGRLGRFLSIDPLFAKYAWNSPYAFAENRVIDGIDVNGEGFGDFVDALANKIYTVGVTIKKTYNTVNNTVSNKADAVMTKVENYIYDKYQAAKKSPIGKALSRATTTYDKINITVGFKGEDKKGEAAVGTKLIDVQLQNQYPNGGIVTKDKVEVFAIDGINISGTNKLSDNVSMSNEVNAKSDGTVTNTPSFDVGTPLFKVFLNTELEENGGSNTTYGCKVGFEFKKGGMEVNISVETGKTSDKISAP